MWCIALICVLSSTSPAATQVATTPAAAPERRIEIVGISRQGDPSHWWNVAGQPIPSPVTEPQIKPPPRAWLGVQLQDLAQNLTLKRKSGYTGKDGVVIVQALPDSPADGKLKPNDIVATVNGKSVATMQSLMALVSAVKPGTSLTLSVFRDGKTQDISVVAAQKPLMEGIYIMRDTKDADTYEMVLRISPWHSDDAVSFAIAGGSGGLSAFSPVIQDGVATIRLAFAMPTVAPQMTLDVGIASASWKTLAQSAEPTKSTVRKFPDGRSITFKPAFKRPQFGNAPQMMNVTHYFHMHSPTTRRAVLSRDSDDVASAVIDVMQTLNAGETNDWDLRLIAAAGDKDVTAAPNYAIIEPKQRNDRFILPNIDPADIDNILLQMRPFQWISLPGIPLRVNEIKP